MYDKAITLVTVDEAHLIQASASSAPWSSFFPWQDTKRLRRDQLMQKATFPWVGFLGLVGAAVTVVLSFVILRSIDGHEVFQSKYVKPAAWLSVILSANSILLHMAMTEGVNISWWYRASNERATAGQLHDTWAFGTSLASALTAGRRFNYLALATIFVCSIPLNGLLLQNAISPTGVISNETMTLSVPMLQEFPLGFSAALNDDDETGLLSQGYAAAVDQWLNLQNDPTPSKIIIPPTEFVTNCSGTCIAYVYGVGFQPSCSSSTVPFNLLPEDLGSNKTSIQARVLDSSVSWSPSKPNRIGLNLLWKNDPSCVSRYEVRNCTLTASVVRYPIVVDWETINGEENQYLYLNPNTTYLDDNFGAAIPRYANEGSNGTTYGGIAQSMASLFNSTIDLGFHKNKWTLNQTGPLAASLYPLIPEGSDAGYCNITLAGLSDVGDTVNTDLLPNILSSLRQLMFASSVYGSFNNYFYYTASNWDYYVQSPQAIQSSPITIYEIYYRYWAASLAVTLTIIVIIIPTFYGYWTLARRTTLSPFETARAFNAPVLNEVDARIETPVLLRHVGSKNVHKELVYQPSH